MSGFVKPSSRSPAACKQHARVCANNMRACGAPTRQVLKPCFGLNQGLRRSRPLPSPPCRLWLLLFLSSLLARLQGCAAAMVTVTAAASASAADHLPKPAAAVLRACAAWVSLEKGRCAPRMVRVEVAAGFHAKVASGLQRPVVVVTRGGGRPTKEGLKALLGGEPSSGGATGAGQLG